MAKKKTNGSDGAAESSTAEGAAMEHTAMASSSAAGEEKESTSKYFRRVLGSHTRWLNGRKNERILDQWQKDHPGEPMTKNVKQILSNVKTTMRKEREESGKGKSKKDREVAPAAKAAPAVKPSNLPIKKLEHLEWLIDEAVIEAKHMGEDELESILNLLKKARREVSFKLAQ